MTTAAQVLMELIKRHLDIVARRGFGQPPEQPLVKAGEHRTMGPGRAWRE